MSGLRLNLGCGSMILEGYLNVDQFGEPDLKFNLETFPWPWEDNSVIEIKLIHVLEHLGRETDVYLKIIQEMYRVCAAGAEIFINVPHHRHDDFVHDPTHVRPITSFGLQMFSKSLNIQWQQTGSATTPLALYLDVDFELTHTLLTPGEAWTERYPNDVQNIGLLIKESKIFNNLIKEVAMTLKVIK